MGTESNVSECSVGSVGQLNCHHGRDVGVICQGSCTEYMYQGITVDTQIECKTSVANQS